MQLSIDMFLCDDCFHGRCYNAEPEPTECPCCIEHIEDLEDRLYPRYSPAAPITPKNNKNDLTK